MAGSLNKVMLIGNLARDPEVRTFDNGGKVCNFRLITNETWTDRKGERQERAEGHNIVIFNERLVDVADKYLRKGDKVYVEGTMRSRKYQDREGNDRYTTEVEVPRYNGVLTMLGGNSDSDRHFDSSNHESRQDNSRGVRDDRHDDQRSNHSRDDNRGGSRGENNSNYDDQDDDLPF